MSAADGARRIRVLERQVTAASEASPPIPGTGQQLLGQVAVITGAGKGIGEATAKLLSQQGASVVVCDLDGQAAEAVAAGIKAAGGQAIPVKCDVTADDAADKVINACVAAFGPSIHILVNNAGFTWDGVIQKMGVDQWDMMLKVHCTAPFRFIQAAAPYMRDAGKSELAAGKMPQQRSIINISSTSGTHGNSGQANYATAKAGIVGLTKTVAKEWGPFGVRCNALAYGLIDTRLTQAKEGGATIQVAGHAVALGVPGADEYFAMVKQLTPLRRSGSVQEAAGAIMLLVSPWASYITGQVLEVNGGSYM